MTGETLTQLIGIGIPTLRELRLGILANGGESDGSGDPVRVLREAGFAGGDAVFEAFQNWLAESVSAGGSHPATDAADAAELPLPEFGERAAKFFGTRVGAKSRSPRAKPTVWLRSESQIAGRATAGPMQRCPAVT